MKSVSRVVAIVQIPAFQYHFFNFLTLILICGTASASIMEKMSTGQKVHSAKEVRIGEVVSTWTSPDPDQKMYFTYVKVRVERTLKGAPVQEVLLRQPGGDYRNPETGKMIHQKVFGMESFQKGEKAIFFITHANDGAPTVMFQGKNSIEMDEETGEYFTVRDKNNPEVEFNGEDHEDHEKALYAAYERKPLNEMVFEIQKAVNEK